MRLKATTSCCSLICGLHGHLRIEVAARHLPGGARQSFDRVSDPFGHVEPTPSPQQDEDRHAEENPAIKVSDLTLDLLLARRKGYGQDRVAATGADRR